MVEAERRAKAAGREAAGARVEAEAALWTTARAAEAPRKAQAAARTDQLSSERDRALAERDRAIAERDALVSSTFWRATRPLRWGADRLPKQVRHVVRRAGKLTWWTLSLQLPRRLRQGRARATRPNEGRPNAPSFDLGRPAAAETVRPRRRANWTDPAHIARRKLFEAMQARAHFARGKLLDLGCGDKPYAGLFTNVRQYIGLDISATGFVDVIGDGQALPFRDGSFDTVVCNEVLEHVPETWTVMAEIFRVLKPGGRLIATAPQTWGLHMVPNDYYRFTEYGLRYLAVQSGFESVEVTPTCGLWATVAQRIADTVIYTYAAHAPRSLVRLLCLLLAPVQFAGAALDAVVGKRGDTLDNVLVGTRRAISSGPRRRAVRDVPHGLFQ